MESNFFHSSLIIVTFMNISIGNCALSIASGRASVADNRFTGSSFMMNRQLADTGSFPDSVMNSYGQVCLRKGHPFLVFSLYAASVYVFAVPWQFWFSVDFFVFRRIRYDSEKSVQSPNGMGNITARHLDTKGDHSALGRLDTSNAYTFKV
jgi:hypothetical protein